MSDSQVPGGDADEALTAKDPSDEAREQLAENDKHLREGDVATPDETVPEEQREKHDESEQASHLMHDEDLREAQIEP